MNAKNNLGRCGEQAAVWYLERAGLHTVSSVGDRRLPSIAPSSKNSPEGLSLLGIASLTHGVINDDYSMTDLPKDGLEVIMDGPPTLPLGTSGKIRLWRELNGQWTARCLYRSLDGRSRRVERSRATRGAVERALKEGLRDRGRIGPDAGSVPILA